MSEVHNYSILIDLISNIIDDFVGKKDKRMELIKVVNVYEEVSRYERDRNLEFQQKCLTDTLLGTKEYSIIR